MRRAAAQRTPAPSALGDGAFGSGANGWRANQAPAATRMTLRTIAGWSAAKQRRDRLPKE